MGHVKIVALFVAFLALCSGVAGASESGGQAVQTPNKASSASRLVDRQLVNTESWHPYITDEGSLGNAWNQTVTDGSGFNPGGYDAAFFSTSNVSRNADGSFTITATPGSSQPGFQWTSGVLSSFNDLSIDGGYVAINAAMPTLTDGAWPGFFLLPGPGNPQTDEIDIFEGGIKLGAVTPNEVFSGTIHSGTLQKGLVLKVRPKLSGSYHVYGLRWIPRQSLTWYLDGKQLFEITSKQFVIPSGVMEFVVTLEIATKEAASWHTLPTNLEKFRMRVKSISVAPLSGPAPWAASASS